MASEGVQPEMVGPADVLYGRGGPVELATEVKVEGSGSPWSRDNALDTDLARQAAD